MLETIGILIPFVFLAGVLVFMFRGASGVASGSVPGWLRRPDTSAGSEIVLDGLLVAVALSQLMYVSTTDLGPDVVGIALGMVTVVGAAAHLGGLLTWAFGALAIVASLPAIAGFLQPEPACASALNGWQRIVLLGAMVSLFLFSSLFGATRLFGPAGLLVRRRYARMGLGWFGAIEFLLALSLLSLATTPGAAFVMAIGAAMLVGAVTPLFPEVTVWAMGVGVAVYGLIGGTLFHYSGEEAVSACLGSQTHIGLLIGYLLTLAVGWLITTPLRRRRQR